MNVPLIDHPFALEMREGALEVLLDKGCKTARIRLYAHHCMHEVETQSRQQLQRMASMLLAVAIEMEPGS